MKSIALATYSIEIRKKYGSANKFEELAKFDGADVLTLFKRFLDGNRSPLNDDTSKTVMQVRNASPEGRNIFGVIETGVYGYTANVYDTKSKKLAHKQTKDQSGMTPFFFQIYIPEEGPNGILSLQRFGNAGIRHIFAKPLKEFFADSHPQYLISFNPIVNKEQMEQMKTGDIQRLTFRQMKLPSDKADSLGTENAKHVYVEYSIVAKRHSALSVLRGMLANWKEPNSQRPLIAQPPKEFNESQVLAKVKVGKSTRTVDVTDLSRMRSYFDLTDTVKIAVDGHPDYQSIKGLSEDLVNDVYSSMTKAA